MAARTLHDTNHSYQLFQDTRQGVQSRDKPSASHWTTILSKNTRIIIRVKYIFTSSMNESIV